MTTTTGTALTVHEGTPTTPESRAVALRPAPVAEVDYGAVLALAKELVPTGFLPDHVKTPGQAVAIILTGRELGMGPMRALRSLQMVKGKVVENADSQLARFKSDGGRARFVELTEAKAVLWLRHPNGDEHTESFTIEDARRAGLAGDNWRKYPKAMLRSRVITSGLKSVGWEGGSGNYDPEEAHGFAPTVVVQPPTAEVEDEGDTVDAEVVDEAAERAERAESDALAALEDMMPSLTKTQREYVKARLGDGADPVALLQALREKLRLKAVSA